MDLYEFKENAVKTESLIDNVTVSREGLTNTLRVFSAIAEVLDMLKKNIFYGKPMEAIKMQTHFVIASQLSRYLERPEVWDSDDTLEINPRIFHALIGIMTESGELSDALLDAIHTNDLDTVNMLEEFGDIAWYEAIAYDELDVDPHDTLRTVIEKLQARYPNKFTSEDAINRDLTVERGILEDGLSTRGGE